MLQRWGYREICDIKLVRDPSNGRAVKIGRGRAAVTGYDVFNPLPGREGRGNEGHAGSQKT